MNDPHCTSQPTFVRYISSTRIGVQSQSLSRHAIGFVVNGKRHIYSGDVYHEVSKSEIFYLGIGTHYIEDIPEGGNFEMVIFYITPDMLSKLINNLSIRYQVSLEPKSCANCGRSTNTIFKSTPLINISFGSVSKMLADDGFFGDMAAQIIKSHEIAYLLLSSGNCCLRNLLLSLASAKRDRLEQIVNQHIFDDISIDDLAGLCNRSLSTFKKEFVKIFSETPHRWIMRQRLVHARLMLISTDRDLSDICQECRFHNSSHFIKLFRREYGTTPAVYRQKYSTQLKMA